MDTARIGYRGKKVVLAVKVEGSNQINKLIFGLGNSGQQAALCGTTAHLTIEEAPKDNDDVFTYGTGAIPEGHISRDGCFDLRLSGGECDSIHVYWNHIENKIDWWRL